MGAYNKFMKRFLQKKYLILILLIVVLLSSAKVLSALSPVTDFAPANTSASSDKPLPKFTKTELKKYNGTNPSLPIYLVLDGYVYDVTKGSEFYKVGGAYHYLAGKDSSFELHMVGGDIIKRKYPVIGRLITN